MGGLHARRNKRINNLREGENRRNNRVSEQICAGHKIRGFIMVKEGTEGYFNSLGVRKTI